jgi:hypothetical protein
MIHTVIIKLRNTKKHSSLVDLMAIQGHVNFACARSFIKVNGKTGGTLPVAQ